MRNPTPSPSYHSRRSPRIPKENADPNRFLPEPPHFKSPSSVGKPLRSPLPPRPPNPTGNPLKRRLNPETAPENGVPTPSESGVQVVVRMRPVNGVEEVADRIVRKISDDSVSVLDHAFTFDFVADTDSTQQEMFQLVGIPLVENCLAGFNSSIFAYGQTGSGKTYTMWGPPNALLEDDTASDARGLTPRVFERLFDRIKEEQSRHSDKQQAYQCRCSFLEIYNEQITDLLDPHQGNLQIREDVRTGVYVENLTEDYVCSMKDVKQLLIKGLVNRRCGATSINAESSRSHCVFTCVVESKTKCMSDGLSSVRISRINLVDLAGSERQKQTGAAGERLKEAGNINRSLSQLGHLINILAEISQSGKQRHIPYRDSRLTFLLQESLGGNAKLALICAISPSQSCKSETISTLRFAQRAKAIKNKTVVNEVSWDDVNVLQEQIRQLKDELLLMKCNGGATGNSQSSLTGWNPKRSLNILRQSLRYPMAIPAIEDDNDEEMEIDEGEVENSSILIGSQTSEDDMNIMDTLLPQLEVLEEPSHLCCDKYVDKDVLARQSTGVDCNNDQCIEVAMGICEPEQISVDQLGPTSFPTKKDSTGKCHGKLQKSLRLCHGSIEGNIAEDNVPLRDSSMLSGSNSKAPSLNLDVKVGFSRDPSQSLVVADNSSRKSQRTSLSMSASCRRISEVEQSGQEVQSLYFTQLLNSCPSTVPFTQMSNHSLAPTRNLATSLHHGLQVVHFHRQTVPLRMFSIGFPSKAVDSKVSLPAAKVDYGMQTLSQGPKISEDPNFMCTYCKNRQHKIEYRDVGVDTELMPLEGSNSIGKSIKQVPRAVEKVLAEAIRREMALEDHCASQAAEITHLNRSVHQYKHERECNMIIEQTLEDKICRLERLLDCIPPSEHFMEEEYLSLANEHKRLKDKYENHPEVLRLYIEVRRARDELDKYRNFFDLGERDVLMEEIQDLRNQLQNYIDCSPSLIRKTSLFPQLKHINEPIVSPLCGASGLSVEFTEKMFEEERGRWTKAESKWISFSEELRLELEATRSFAEKQKVELDSEKKCLEELKEALRTAMQGHAHILDQYADLQEKHIALLARHRKIQDGIVDVKKAASRAGIKGAESKFIDSLAAEISALKAERGEERLYWRDENKRLQSQLRDTAEALQAAGELLLRLKEAEDAAATAQRRTAVAENEAENAYKEMHSLKKTHEKEITMLNHFHAESHNIKEARKPKGWCGESPYSTL